MGATGRVPLHDAPDQKIYKILIINNKIRNMNKDSHFWRNPDDSAFEPDASASPVNTQYLGRDPTRLIRSQKLHGVYDVIR